jgi:ATP:cob(I)alamin adenosyltransferase
MIGKIYTKGGDAGETSLLSGGRVAKDDPRVNVYGTLDEATSALGMARAATGDNEICNEIIELQGELINIMAEVATRPSEKPPKFEIPKVTPEQVERLEHRLDYYLEERVPIKGFVRPGVSLAAGALDMARSTVRRAERFMVTLSRTEDVSPVLIKYVNRLSDLLYIMARIDEQREVGRIVAKSLAAGLAQKSDEVAPKMSGLSRKDCDRMVEAGINRAKAIGIPVVLAVANPSGNLVELRRMDNALEISVTLAPHKAYTAASVRMPTHQLAALSQPGQPLYGIDMNIPNLTLVGGGLPLMVDGNLWGAVGGSGGSVEQDIDIAQAMAAAL